MRAAAAAVVIILVMAGLAYYYANSRERGGTETISVTGSPSLVVHSPAYANGSIIPRKYTCSGEDVSPPLVIENIPEKTKALALIMYDPDAPGGIFYHWVLYDVPANARVVLPEALPRTPVTDYGVQGLNSFKALGYGGPCPPPGSKHRYYILVLALDAKLGLKPGATAGKVLGKARGHILAYGVLLGYYSR